MLLALATASACHPRADGTKESVAPPSVVAPPSAVATAAASASAERTAVFVVAAPANSAAAPAPAIESTIAQTDLAGPLLRPELDVKWHYRRIDGGNEPSFTVQMVPIPSHPELFRMEPADFDGLLLGGALSVTKAELRAVPATLAQGMGKPVVIVRPKVGGRAEVPSQLGKTEVTVVARETIEVPAGRFDAFKVTFRSLDTHTLWLAPSVGIVRVEWPSGRVDVLAGREHARPLLDPAECESKLAKPLAFESTARGFTADCVMGKQGAVTVYRALDTDATRPVWLKTVPNPGALGAESARLGADAIDVATHGATAAIAVSIGVDWRTLLK